MSNVLNQILPVISQTYDPEFQRDIIDFFHQRRTGHIGTWRYSEPVYPGDRVMGMQYWANLTRSARNGNNYYIFNEEIEAIRLAAKNLKNVIPENGTLIDLGPGSPEAILEKTGPFISNLSIKNYIGIDISNECLDWASETINTNFKDVAFHRLNCDFYESAIIYPECGIPIMCMFGQTIFNLPINPFDLISADRMVIQRLKKFKKSLGKTGYLIITQDCNQSKSDIYKAYMEAKDFNLNLLHRIERDLPVTGDFNPEGFEFEPMFIPETGAATLTYVSKFNMDFSIGDEYFSLKKGQRFYLHNSYKFELARFQRMAWAAGFRIHFSQFTKSRRMALHVLRVNG